jgi:hypothetical protein
MNDNIKAGAEIHAGDGGYRIGTQEKYDEFVKGRNQSLANMRIKELKEQAMEWVPNLVDPDTKIRLLNAEKFAELIVRECIGICEDTEGEHIVDARWGKRCCALEIKQHFGVEE